MEVVGLKTFVQDDVNKLIAKFVGYRSKPAQVIQNMLNTYCFINGADYLEFLRQRLILLRELMADDGSIYVHLDENMAFPAKVPAGKTFPRLEQV